MKLPTGSPFQVLSLLVAFVASGLFAAPLRYVPPRGELGIHDPSSIVAYAGRFHLFGTGQGIFSRSSDDRALWVDEPPVFSVQPAWIASAVPGFDGTFWAPDVIEVSGRYHLYYSCSTWGSPVSAIGLAIFDPAHPGAGWVDHGSVIQSDGSQGYNAIDPSVCLASDGRLWMAFGSYWNGIFVFELDPATGLRLHPGTAPVRVATRANVGDSIEASCLFQHGSYFYLMVDWGTCCSGINSTYRMRMGRSASPTGPFFDRNGTDLRNGGGTLFLEATGKYVGPGHFALYREDDREWFGYHYYDAGQYEPSVGTYGKPMFDLRPLQWSDDGWPLFTNDWVATYRFAGSGQDDGGRYFGLLQGNAAIRSDPMLGTVLDLDGADAYVQLPVGVANARTFTANVKWNGGGDWQRIFDFGSDTAHFCFLSPAAGDNGQRPHFSINSGSGAQVVNAPDPLPQGVWTHLAVTVGDDGGTLYVDGVPVASNPAMDIVPFEVKGTNNMLGRSQFVADPDFNGQISSFRAYDRALSASEIVAPHVDILEPSDGGLYAPGQTVSFRGYATDFRDIPLTNTSWWAEHIENGVTNPVLGTIVGRTGGTFTAPASTGGVVRLRFSGTDTQARTAHKTIELLPGPAGAWTAFYSFDNGGADANGSFDATLVNGASTPVEAVRGSVLELDGIDGYVDLPDGLTSLRTIAAWVKLTGYHPWERIFDLGIDTNRFCMLAPVGPEGTPIFSFYVQGMGGARNIVAPDPLPLNTWVHMAVVFDGDQIVLYIDGKAVAVRHSANLLPSDLQGTNNYLGRSQFVADPYFSGRMDSVLVTSRALELTEFLPLQLAIGQSSGNVVLSWPATSDGRMLHQAPELGEPTGWTPAATAPTTTNGMRLLTTPASGLQQFHRLQWP